MKTKFLIAISALVMAGMACSFSQATQDIGHFLAPLTGPLGSATNPFANTTITPTPFLPQPDAAIAAPTPAPEVEPIVDEFEEPSLPSELPVPEPVAPLDQPDGQINILLLGSDQRLNTGGFRTDTIVLLTVDPESERASMTSFPRDTFVYIPGWTMQRINTAQQYGGFEALQSTFEYNFGIRPDFYVMINFWTFEQGIDSLGGIDVKSARTMTDWRDGYGNYTVPAGTVHMDGETALWYVRARYATSDYDRTRRQQEVLVAAFNRLISLNALGRVPELYSLYNQSVITNMSLEDGRNLLGTAAKISQDSSRLHSYFIGENQGRAYTLPSSGAWVFLPDFNAVRKVLYQAVNFE